MAGPQQKPDFNEYTYGQNLTTELHHWLRNQKYLTGAPVLPTLRQEATLGYDAGLPLLWGMLYLQFKIPTLMQGNRSGQLKSYHQPYFRFRVKTDPTKNGKIQHNTLVDLESEAGLVFYASACFIDGSDLDDFALNDGMRSNSVFPKPSLLSHVAAHSTHHYAYTTSRDVRAFSDPTPEADATFERVTGEIQSHLIENDEAQLPRFLSRTATQLEELTDSRSSQDSPPLERIRTLSSRVGLQPFLIGLKRR